MSRKISRKIVLTVFTVGALALAATPAFAGKPGGGAQSGSNIRLVLMDGATEARYGGRITFDFSTSTDKPYINLRCYQGATHVYDAWVGYYAGAWFAQDFTLVSSYWTGGAADCTARLVMFARNGAERTLSTLNFRAAA